MGYTLEQPRMIEQMVELGVQMHPNTTAKAWTGTALKVKRSDTYQDSPDIGGATLIHVGARRPADTLLTALKADQSISDGVTGMGDCLAPGIIQAAVFSGHHAARRLIGDAPASGQFKRETPVLFPN